MGYARILRFMLVALLMAGLGGCAADGSGGCYVMHCTAAQKAAGESCLNNQKMPKYTIPTTDAAGNPVPHGGEELGVVSYLTIMIRAKVLESSEKVYEKIVNNEGFKNLVTGAMLLFVILYAITIALGMANPSPAELVIRASKMAIIYFLLAGWSNFNEEVVGFFEAFVDDLTDIMTSAVTGADIKGMDVMAFVDDKVLGYLFSVKFAVTLGAIAGASIVGPVIAPMLLGIMLMYLWSLVIGIQIYLLSSIARALLYAIAPIFLIFLLFQQTKSLFDGWLKQLMNFTLQPVLLIAFMAFFNGVFFNFLDHLFKEDYKVCFGSNEGVAGQTLELSEFKFEKVNADTGAIDILGGNRVTETMNIFNLFITMILALTMVKMNQWVVQSSAQLTEGGLSFGATMNGWAQTQSSISQSFSGSARRIAGVPEAKPKR